MSSNLSQYFARSISLQRSILGAACGPPANARQHKNQISNISSGAFNSTSHRRRNRMCSARQSQESYPHTDWRLSRHAKGPCRVPRLPKSRSGGAVSGSPSLGLRKGPFWPPTLAIVASDISLHFRLEPAALSLSISENQRMRIQKPIK